MDLGIKVVTDPTKKRRGSDDKITIKQHVSFLDEENLAKRGP